MADSSAQRVREHGARRVNFSTHSDGVGRTDRSLSAYGSSGGTVVPEVRAEQPTDTEEHATPRFSVLVPAYNAVATIGETLESLLAQTRGDWEAIVVDDGSTDATPATAASYALRDARIRVLSKPNGGTASARNLGARSTAAPLLCLLDADDTYLPAYFERMGRFTDEHPGFDIYSCGGYLLQPSGERRPSDPSPEDAPLYSYRVEDLLVRNRIWVQSVVRRSTFDLVDGFNEDPAMLNEDYDFWLRALLRGAQHIHNPEHLWVHRVNPKSKSADDLAVARGNAFVLDCLIESGILAGGRLQAARRARARLERAPEELWASRARESLEARLLGGDLTDVRRLYVGARRAYPSRVRYVVGLGLVLVSPSLFGWALRRRGTSTTWVHGRWNG